MGAALLCLCGSGVCKFVCVHASMLKVFLSGNHNEIIMTSFSFLFPASVAPEKPELRRPSSQAITAGETTSSEVIGNFSHNVGASILSENTHPKLVFFCFGFSDWCL